MTLVSNESSDISTDCCCEWKGTFKKTFIRNGLTPHTLVKIRKVAPMGDPIEVYLRSYVLIFEERGCFFN